MSLTGRGPLCRCGNRGCLEASIAVPRLVAAASAAHGREVTFTELTHLAAAGDVACTRIVRKAGRQAGHALGTLANVLDPEMIVVGGPLLRTGSTFLTAAEKTFRAAALPMHVATPIRAALLGRHAAAMGAAGFAFSSGFDALLTRQLR